MNTCASCGSPAEDEGRFCSACGQPVRVDKLAVPPQYAGFWQRFAALLVDLVTVPVLYIAVTFIIFVFIGFFALSGLFFSEEEITEDALFAIVSVIAAIAVVVYVWLGNSLGGTLGKRALGLRVVSASDGANIGPLRALVRYLIYVIGAIPLCLGWLWSIWDGQKQTWHDKAAGSIVVKKG